MFPTLNFSKVCRPKNVYLDFILIVEGKKNLNKTKNVYKIIYFIT